MKYALQGQRGIIRKNSIGDTEPTPNHPNHPNQTVVQLTDEQATEILNSTEVVCLIDGALVPYFETEFTNVPSEVTMAQFREQLIREGIKANVDAAIAAIADPTTKELFENWYDYALHVKRDNEKVNAMAAQLGYTSDYVDLIFKRAIRNK